MTPASDDIYSLESWLRDKALEAHNESKRYADLMLGDADPKDEKLHDLLSALMKSRERMANETIAYIQSMRVSQRPHVHGKV